MTCATNQKISKKILMYEWVHFSKLFLPENIRENCSVDWWVISFEAHCSRTPLFWTLNVYTPLNFHQQYAKNSEIILCPRFEIRALLENIFQPISVAQLQVTFQKAIKSWIASYLWKLPEWKKIKHGRKLSQVQWD